MRHVWTFRSLLIVLAVAAGASGADAQMPPIRWPAATALPRPSAPPNPPPAVLERAPSAVIGQVSGRQAAAVCRAERACVVCVAACDRAPPAIVQALEIRPTGAAMAATAETNADGIADGAPRFARTDWSGITCGTDSGCRVSGVDAPKRATEIDVRMTIFAPIGSTSRYIDR